MRWPFPREASESRYQRIVKEIAEGLCGAAFILMGRLKEGWASLEGASDLNNEQLFGVVREVLWYLLSECDRVARVELHVEPHQADKTTRDITERSLDKLMMMAFDFSDAADEEDGGRPRQAKLEQLRKWQAEAAIDYGRPPPPMPTPERQAQIIRTGSLVPESPMGRLAHRIEGVVGVPFMDRGSIQTRKGIYARVISEGVSVEDWFVLTIASASIRKLKMRKELHDVYTAKSASLPT